MKILKHIQLVSLVLLSIKYFSHSASILFYFGTSPLGHRLAAWPLVTELTNRGHNVTFLSSFPNKIVSHKNVKEISIPKVASSFNKNPIEMRESKSEQVFWDIAPIDALLVCEVILSDKSIHSWVKTSHYDLVIIDSENNDCGLGFAYLFRAKHIMFIPSSLFMSHPDAYGFPAESSWIPDLQRNYPQDMNYFQRFSNAVRSLRWHIFRESYVFPQHKRLFKTHWMNEELPPFRDIEKNTSLVLLNSHFSEEYARSLPPLVVSVGGIHVSGSNNLLPKEILNFIDNKPFVYMSFGSTLSLSSFNRNYTNIFMTALKNCGLKIMLKSDVTFDYVPSNVYINNWLPQQDILSHPKIVGFISQGSSLSIQEAIYHAVPLIVLPVFKDQDSNSLRMEQLGVGIKLEIIDELLSNKLQRAIEKLIQDKTIRENISKLSQKFRDRAMKPLELSTWWIEYVLRHEDNNSLKPLSINNSWFHRRLLDVWFTLFIIIILALLGVFLLCKYVLSTFMIALIEYFDLHKEKSQ